jgi:hypothetical protein
MDVDGGHLAADRGAVSIAGPMYILVAVAALERLHSGHPEVSLRAYSPRNPMKIGSR